MKPLKLAIIAIIGVFILRSDSRPLSVRNRNPLNIRFNEGNKWRGQIGQSGGFAKFDRPENGFRAGVILFRNYREIHKLSTIEQIIGRFAPSIENPTENYIDFVASELGKRRDSEVFEHEYPRLMIAMSTFEGGAGHWSIEQAEQGLSLA